MSDPASPLGKPLTVAEFLEFDDGTDTRYELVEGRPTAMDPAAVPHVVIHANLFRRWTDNCSRRVEFSSEVGLRRRMPVTNIAYPTYS